MNQHDAFFIQRIPVRDHGPNRTQFLCESVYGKKTLHVGCADWPIFNHRQNLHLQLALHASELDGCDTSKEGLALVARHYRNGKYFSELGQAVGRYDLILAADVLEHVPDAQKFLIELFAIQSSEIIITVPNFTFSSESSIDCGQFVEIVHPDHYCWYSPATLRRSLSTHLRPSDQVEFFFLEGRKTVGARINRT